MRTLILAAGRFGDDKRRAIAEGREPHLDVFELAKTLNADVIDFWRHFGRNSQFVKRR